jgi:hypothetical protein
MRRCFPCLLLVLCLSVSLSRLMSVRARIHLFVALTSSCSPSLLLSASHATAVCTAQVQCQAILNPFCSIDTRSKFWVCAICGQRNQFPPHYKDISEQNLP